MIYPSKLIEEAVEEFAKLPGIGKKTALRLVLHLLRQNPEQTENLSESLTRMRNQVTYCRTCHNISDSEICNICSSPLREQTQVCVVSDTRDVIAIENTGQFKGLYHVLGGVISPIEGIGPSDLTIGSLLERIAKSEIKEVILAISPTMEGDTTSFYITRKLKDQPVKISNIARGIPVGGELEYTDEITLGRSIVERTQYGR